MIRLYSIIPEAWLAKITFSNKCRAFFYHIKDWGISPPLLFLPNQSFDDKTCPTGTCPFDLFSFSLEREAQADIKINSVTFCDA